MGIILLQIIIIASGFMAQVFVSSSLARSPGSRMIPAGWVAELLHADDNNKNMNPADG